MIADMVLTAVAVILIVNVLVCLTRVLAGPTGRDRVTGVLFAGTTGAAVLLIASLLTGLPALRDVALALVALAATIVVVRVAAERRRDEKRRDGGTA